MDDHVNPMDGMRPDGDYTAAQLGELLRLLNANYHLRGGDINTHLVLGGIRFSDPPTLDTCNKWLTDSGPVAEAAMMPGGGTHLAHRISEGDHRHRGRTLSCLRRRP